MSTYEDLKAMKPGTVRWMPNRLGSDTGSHPWVTPVVRTMQCVVSKAVSHGEMVPSISYLTYRQGIGYSSSTLAIEWFKNDPSGWTTYATAEEAEAAARALQAGMDSMAVAMGRNND